MKWNSDLKLTRDFLQENWKWIVAKLPVADGKDWESERRQTRGLNKYLPYSHVSAVQCAVPRPPQSQTPGFWHLPEVIHPPKTECQGGSLCSTRREKFWGENWLEIPSFISFSSSYFFLMIFKNTCSEINRSHCWYTCTSSIHWDFNNEYH